MATTKFTGKDMSAMFGSTNLTCLQSFSITSNVGIQTIECAGASSIEKVPGLPNYTGSCQLALQKTDVTLLNAVLAGDQDTLTFYPAGNTATYIKVSSTNVTINSHNIQVATNGFGTLDLGFDLDDLTYAAAV